MLLINSDPRPFFLCGMEDGSFLRGSVPMTKREIRAQAAVASAAQRGERRLRIGAGTGSVTVEMALAGLEGKRLCCGTKPGGRGRSPSELQNVFWQIM